MNNTESAFLKPIYRRLLLIFLHSALHITEEYKSTKCMLTLGLNSSEWPLKKKEKEKEKQA